MPHGRFRMCSSYAIAASIVHSAACNHDFEQLSIYVEYRLSFGHMMWRSEKRSTEETCNWAPLRDTRVRTKRGSASQGDERGSALCQRAHIGFARTMININALADRVSLGLCPSRCPQRARRPDISAGRRPSAVLSLPFHIPIPTTNRRRWPA